MATKRLYWDDPFLGEFRARFVGHRDGSLVLDQTAFYPEAGGQMADRGLLAGLAVVDVQVDDDGTIVHRVGADSELPAVGEEIGGTIDRARRRTHMALHTGQHMLSRALLDEMRGETVSSRLGENACTIDLAIGGARDKGTAINEADLSRAEDLVNAVIDDDVAVRAFFPAPAELAALPLRRDPKVTDNVRIVAVGEFDFSPCGGTHCTRSAQVGLVRVTGVERYKGLVRVTFTAGPRARGELWRHDEVLRSLGREMTCGPAEVPAGLAKLRRDLAAVREALGQSRARLANAEAGELLADARRTGSDRVTALLDGDVEYLRAVAKRITAEAGMSAVLGAAGAESIHVLCARGPGSSFDCGAFLKALAAASRRAWRGSAERAEGKIPLAASVAFAPPATPKLE